MNWISVEDRLPEKDQDVLYFFEVTGVHSGKYLGIHDGYECFGGDKGWLCGDVTHWQPLPAPPTDKPKEVTEIGPKDFY